MRELPIESRKGPTSVGISYDWILEAVLAAQSHKDAQSIRGHRSPRPPRSKCGSLHTARGKGLEQRLFAAAADATVNHGQCGGGFDAQCQLCILDLLPC